MNDKKCPKCNDYGRIYDMSKPFGDPTRFSFCDCIAAIESQAHIENVQFDEAKRQSLLQEFGYTVDVYEYGGELLLSKHGASIEDVPMHIISLEQRIQALESFIRKLRDYAAEITPIQDNEQFLMSMIAEAMKLLSDEPIDKYPPF